MFYITLLVFSFIAGAYLKPAITNEQGKWYFHLSFGKGNRNKYKLF